MFEIYSIYTGKIIATYRDRLKAHQMTISYSETFAWIDGDKFEYRIKE